MAALSSQPQPPVKLHLESPTRVYRPGDKIAGSMEVTQAATVPPLVLQGVIGVKIDGQFTPAAIVLWQDITIEEDTALSTATKPAYRMFRFDTTIGKGETSAALPPTCMFVGRGHKNVELYCMIEYAVTALEPADPARKVGFMQRLRGNRPKYLVSAPFWLLSLPPPVRHFATGLSQPEYIRYNDPYKRLQFSSDGSTTGGNTGLDGKTSFLRRMSSGSKNSCPQTAFSVTLFRPHLFRLGDVFEVDIELRPYATDIERRARESGKKQMPSIKPVAVPDVDLMSAKVQLMCKTSIGPDGHAENWDQTLLTLTKSSTTSETLTENQEPGSGVLHWSASAFLDQLSKTGSSPLWVSKTTASSAPPQSDGIADLRRRLAFDAPIPTRLVPTFKSFGITRTYSWGLELDFKCAGQTQKLYYRFPDALLAPHDTTDASFDWGPHSLRPEEALLLEEAGVSAVQHAESKWDSGSRWVAAGVQIAYGVGSLFM